jgi:hypothetical protein
MPVVVMDLVATEVDSRMNPAAGKQLGAMWIGTDDLRDRATNADVGTHSGVCVRTRKPGKPDLWVCQGGWDLLKAGPVTGGRKGYLTSVGPADFTAVNFKFAICGGTDDFAKARGQLEGDSTNYPPRTDYRLEFEIP